MLVFHGSDFSASPMVFEYKVKILVAAATKDARIHLLDSASLTALASSQTGAGAAVGLASWQDAGGTRWILAAAGSAVVAWKVADGPSLQPGWVSREVVSALTPMIVNGVAFAVSGGESSHAVLYTLDGATGNAVWNSGNTIGSFMHGGGLSGGSGQLYLGTRDGTLYAFGFPIEH